VQRGPSVGIRPLGLGAVDGGLCYKGGGAVPTRFGFPLGECSHASVSRRQGPKLSAIQTPRLPGENRRRGSGWVGPGRTKDFGLGVT